MRRKEGKSKILFIFEETRQKDETLLIYRDVTVVAECLRSPSLRSHGHGADRQSDECGLQYDG